MSTSSFSGSGRGAKNGGKSNVRSVRDYIRDENNPRLATLSPAALQRFCILTFKNSTYIFRRFFDNICINECFISVIFYTRFILLIKR